MRCPQQQGRFLPSRRDGSALAIVMSAIIIVGVAVAGFAELSAYRSAEAANSAKAFRARLAAESGLAIGLHPDIQGGDPALSGEAPGGGQYNVIVTSEGGKIPINKAGTDQMAEILAQLFENWQVDPQQASLAADALADWVDEDDDPRSNGAERDYYEALGERRLPRNRAFTSLQEMLLVPGMGAVDRARPDWRDFFTVYGDGLIDVNAAPAEILEAVTGTTAADAERAIAVRAGGDNEEFTDDDTPFEELDEFRNNIGISAADWEEIEPLLTVQGSAIRVQSTALVGDLQHTTVLIAERVGEGNYSYLARFERQLRFP